MEQLTRINCLEWLCYTRTSSVNFKRRVGETRQEDCEWITNPYVLGVKAVFAPCRCDAAVEVGPWAPHVQLIFIGLSGDVICQVCPRKQELEMSGQTRQRLAKNRTHTVGSVTVWQVWQSGWQRARLITFGMSRSPKVTVTVRCVCAKNNINIQSGCSSWVRVNLKKKTTYSKGQS